MTDIGRYSRQVLFQPIGREGQSLLRKARVAVVGMGALGTVLSSQLVRAGVGFIRLIDRDIIEPSNLQRQSLYDELDAEQGRAKAEVAAEKLRAANSDVEIEIAIEDVNSQNGERLLSDVDLVMDGTDNFEVRYLINDIAVKHNIPWSYGGAVSSYGTTAFFRPGQTPCLVCLFGLNQTGGGHDTCDTVGVIAPIVSIIASYQIAEALKYLTGNLHALSNSVTYLDVWKNEFRSVQFGLPKGACPCCHQHRFIALEGRTNGLTVSLCGRKTIQVRPTVGLGVSLMQMAQQLAKFGEVRHNPNLLRCDFGDTQLTLFADGRALFHGVEDEKTARNLYARYIGI
ncbi:ThiF family adenylyltransferase [Alicyclobacillus dauci]|uniref:ThiF family adenylyltransferase n=1 Tax=Alicyclobacillus dauci TaxID=1475485 RepID=A0ABY6Z242_9BACL|nr:ThiF family adenylyltransferase [Alicyclobacillus dauci]WAH36964.1 ThiF family adenylyltransferase [Alicyclobacillus dauci]